MRGVDWLSREIKAGPPEGGRSAVDEFNERDLYHVSLLSVLSDVHQKEVFVAVELEHVIVNFDCNPVNNTIANQVMIEIQGQISQISKTKIIIWVISVVRFVVVKHCQFERIEPP